MTQAVSADKQQQFNLAIVSMNKRLEPIGGAGSNVRTILKLHNQAFGYMPPDELGELLKKPG
jgi:hypothetical protein